MDWQTRIPGAVPVVCRRMHRVFWVPPRYRSLIAIGLSGPFTLRDAAARTGYSLHGVWAAMRSLEEMAIARFTSTRGRRGGTSMLLSSDAEVDRSGRFVPPTATARDRETDKQRTEQGTFDLQAYKELLARKMRRAMGLPDEDAPAQERLELATAL